MVSLAEKQEIKTGWTSVKFGDVVKLSKARCSDPEGEGIERYVGLEHIDTDDLRIRRWGLVEEGTTFTTLFKPGQVLFGKRRAYLRKVAVADFEGVCSGDIYVFESADPKVLLPELLPFICQTERFFEFAIGTSAGSLSPRTNWKSLVNFEFALPPLEEQRHVLSTIQSLDMVSESYFSSYEKSFQLEDSFLKSRFGKYSQKLQEWEYTPLRKIAFIQSGIAKGKKSEPGKTTEMPYLRVANVQEGYLDLSDIKSIVVEKNKIDQFLLRDGDVLMTEGGDLDKLGRGTVWKCEVSPCVHQNHIFAVRPNQEILNSWFLAAVAKSTYGKQYFLSRGKRTSNLATINKAEIGNLLVPLPPLHHQVDLVEEWQAIRESIFSLKERLTSIQRTRNLLVADCFGG